MLDQILSVIWQYLKTFSRQISGRKQNNSYKIEIKKRAQTRLKMLSAKFVWKSYI